MPVPDMPQRKIPTQSDLPWPEPLPEQAPDTEPKTKPLRSCLWTEHKAKLIERYLYYFVLITKHGTYIDGFAGPQQPSHPDTWAAKLVLENEPRRLRHFHLFDINQRKYERLLALKAEQPERDSKGRKLSRTIEIYKGDFNERIREVLDSGTISQKEATFCLLDQITFNCKWSTVEALARYKQPGFNKFELFYFLPNHWLDRSLAGLKRNTTKLELWWGRDDWGKLRQMSQQRRRDELVNRFRKEFGYKSVKAYPIFDRLRGGYVMYYMIHATDHDQAPILMTRAYNNAVRPKESAKQLEWEFRSLFTAQV